MLQAVEIFFIQPIIDLRSGQVCGGEVMWRPSGGPPSSEQLQELEGDPTLNILVGQESIAFALRALERLPENIWLSLKLSCRYIGSSKLFFRPIARAVGDLDAIRRSAGRRLVVEITESQASRQNEDFVAEIGSLNAIAVGCFRNEGISLSESLSLKFCTAKADRSVVSGVDSDSSRQRALKWLVAGCHAIDVTVCAEGVETESEASFLRSLGVDHAQGLLWNPAIEFETFAELCGSRGREVPQSMTPPPAALSHQIPTHGLLVADC